MKFPSLPPAGQPPEPIRRGTSDCPPRCPTQGCHLAGRPIGRLVLATALLILLALAPPPSLRAEFPPELVSFVACEGNPVFRAGPAGAWDQKIRERGWILHDGQRYRMWYTGYDGTREGLKMLGHATSRDGIVWRRDARNPIYRDHWVEDMMVVKHGGRYLMFAEGRDDQAHLLTSPDGIRWQRVGPLDIRRTDGTPIAPGPYGTPTVWHEDGLWHLFYERRDEAVWLATSRDLKTWTHVQDEPVLRPGPQAYDRQMIALNQVIKHRGRYYAFYHGSGDAQPPRAWTTNIAVSDNLIAWRKYAGNPIVPGDRSSGIVVRQGDRFWLYTMHGQVDLFLPAERR
jgi:hypothetical protein